MNLLNLKVFKWRGLLTFYIASEMLVTWFMVLSVLLCIFVILRALNLTNLILQHEAGLYIFAELLIYVFLSLLPFLSPISFLLAASLTYDRLTHDSEVMAIKSLGLNSLSLIFPGLFLSVLMSVFCLYGSFHFAPWGNSQLEDLVANLASSKIISNIQEGTFSEDFFDLILYTSKVEGQKDELQKVFIFDERNKKNPLAIVAQKGTLKKEKDSTSYKAFLRLKDGSIHRNSKGKHTKIDFEKYDIKMATDFYQKGRDKSPASLTYSKLLKRINSTNKDKKKRTYKGEIQKRISHSLSCIFFLLLAFGLACRNHSRIHASGVKSQTIGIIVFYWSTFLFGNWLIPNKAFYLWFGAWLPLFVFLPLSFLILYRTHKRWI